MPAIKRSHVEAILERLASSVNCNNNGIQRLQGEEGLGEGWSCRIWSGQRIGLHYIKSNSPIKHKQLNQSSLLPNLFPIQFLFSQIQFFFAILDGMFIFFLYFDSFFFPRRMALSKQTRAKHVLHVTHRWSGSLVLTLLGTLSHTRAFSSEHFLSIPPTNDPLNEILW